MRRRGRHDEPLTPAERLRAEIAYAKVEPLARRFARRFPSIPESDFASHGDEAAVRLARTYDVSKGELDAYAYHSVRRAMQSLARRSCKEQLVLVHDDDDTPLAPTDAEAHHDTLEQARQRAGEYASAHATRLVLAQLASKRLAAPDRIIAREEWTALDQALDSIGEPARTVLRLHYREGLTLEKVGQATGAAKRTVQRQIDDAIPTLRARLSARSLSTRPPMHDGEE